MKEHNEPVENTVDDDAGRPSDDDDVGQTDRQNIRTDRRTLLKGVGVAGGAALAGGGATQMGYGPVQEAEAVAPLVAAGVALAAGAGVGAGWALREVTADAADQPSDGLSDSALYAEVYQTSLTRQSVNASTFIDNENIANAGVEHAAYADGKIAAIEALNAEKTQSEVKTAATKAVESYGTIVVKNLLKSWNESAVEFRSIKSKVESSGLSLTSVIRTASGYSGWDHLSTVGVVGLLV